jgi:N-methylhydantoinase B
VTTVDPIRLELIKNALDAIVDEMAIALMRSAYSTNIKTAMDMSCALCDAQGRLIAQGLTLPLHLGSIPDAIAEVIRKLDARVLPGDAYLLNDPYQGGTHLPDFYLFKPIHLDDTLIGWSVSIGHQTDVGGMTAGGYGSDAT